MIAIGSLALLRPWWLLALPAVAAAFLLTRARGGTLGNWDKAADSHLLAAMVTRGASVGGRLRAPAILFALVLGILALAGPAIRQTNHDRLRNLDATVLIVDVSSDMTNSAIRGAASAAHEVLQRVPARQAGLIVYAGDAYVASGLTDFSGALDNDLFALDDTIVPDPGIRPDRALALARTMLEQAHVIHGDVVLLSSGGGLEGTAATREASALAAAGHRLYTIDVATAAKGSPRSSAALADLAAAGDGFSVATLQPARLLDALSQEGVDRTASSIINTLDWSDLGRILLLLAALPLLLEFRKAETV